MKAYTGGKIFTGHEMLTGFAVETEGGRIVRICREIEAKGEKIHLDGRILCAGFIDLQVNGGGGVLFNENPTRDGIAAIYEAHRKKGTACICPTFITDDADKLNIAASAVSSCDDTYIPALHIEGFFISHEKKGIHDERFILPASEENLRKISSCGTCSKIITLAPECLFDMQKAMEILKDSIVFCGHSAADDETIARFFECGGVGATHLYNAMRGLRGRETGVIGAVLDSEKAYAGIICDGAHVSFRAVRIAKRILGERLFLVSDAMPPACSDITEYSLYGRHITVKDGVCVGDDGTIAGSCLCMADAVKNCVGYCGIDLCEALRMASLYPARVLGRDDMGEIKAGNRAIFTAIDERTFEAEAFG